MDEKLLQALNKIIQLTEQNPEFGAELRKRLGMTSSVKAISHSSDFDKRVEHIEKYLGLDYYIDGQPSLIDYSFIEETEIQAQLISDNREMMRYRYGTRFHIINFDEYCRYAHLQVEMLLNYYYDKTSSTLDEIKAHVVKYNPTADIANAKSLGAISYNSKLWAFCTEHNVGYSTRTIFDYIREVRNRSSHRSPETEDSTISNVQKRLKMMSLPVHKEDGYVLTYKLKEASTEYNLFNNMVKKSDWYKEYLFDFNYRNVDFRCCISFDDNDDGDNRNRPYWGIKELDYIKNTHSRIFESLYQLIINSNKGFHNYDNNGPEWVISNYSEMSEIVERFTTLTAILYEADSCCISLKGE